MPRSDLRAAVANIGALAPPPDADLGGEWRAGLVERYAVVRRFLPRLCATIDFEATAEAVPVLDALRQLPGLVEARATKRVPTTYLDVNMVVLGVVPAGWWRQLVLPADRPRARCTGPRTCSASSSSSISASAAATSSPPPRPAGPTQEHAC